MRISKIELKQKTKEESYILITFKTWWGKEFTEMCFSPNSNISTIYAKNGESIPVGLWDVVNAFLRTEDEQHEY